jgi:hypothetical protein
MGFHITKKNPAVGALAVHLPSSSTYKQYKRRDNNTSSLSQLDHYFLRPDGCYTTPSGDARRFTDLSYCEYYSTFRLAKFDPAKSTHPNYYVEQENRDRSTPMHVILRDRLHPFITRLHTVPPSRGELFNLRAVLQHSPALSFLDARTVNGIECDSFQNAANEHGIFANENEAQYALRECVQTLRTPRQLRALFVHLLVNDCITIPLQIWEVFLDHLCYDYTLKHNNVCDVGKEHALLELDEFLEEHGRTLADYGLPRPLSRPREVERELERWGSDSLLLAARARHSESLFNNEQRQIYNAVITSVHEGRQLLAFVDGKGGRGKTFILQAICDHVRSIGRLFLPGATSAFAAQNYEGGRTIHSVFKVRTVSASSTNAVKEKKVPVNDRNEMLASPIQPHDPRGRLIREFAVICWDEATMANRAVLACVDDVCRRIMGRDIAFGGKTVILLGDFRQTGPVIRCGSRKEVVDTSIRISSLWPKFQVFRLEQPI